MLFSQKHILPEIIRSKKLARSDINITSSITKELIQAYTREAGVRDLAKLPKSLIQKPLLEKARTNKTPTLNKALLLS
ncbi:MAG: hypothetical protein COA94_03625 [Rickettsiales bacterium]|nr:MAG: hypothetical protein COA94_03625 [Rickettsiales bacterium]